MEGCKKGQEMLWKFIRRSRNVMEGYKKKVKKCYGRL